MEAISSSDSFSRSRAAARARASSTFASSMLLGGDGHVGDDLDAARRDLHEPFADGERFRLALVDHDDLARHDLGDQVHVLRIHADLALDDRAA